ncbi:hypothetical protein Tco_1282393 [Tanacetum coccineum]
MSSINRRTRATQGYCTSLARIGLLKSRDPDDHISGGASPSLQRTPINAVTAAIKDKVNIIDITSIEKIDVLVESSPIAVANVDIVK